MRFPALDSQGAAIRSACSVAVTVFEQGGQLLVCGNGGSAADSIHIAGELAKSYLLRRPLTGETRAAIEAGIPGPDSSVLLRLESAVPVIALPANVALVSAIMNDIGPESVFAQQVIAHGRAGDLLLGLTTSGSSDNVIRAFQAAHVKRMKTICLTGSAAPEWLGELVDIVITVPAEKTPEVQELHLPVYHAFCEIVESELFDE